MKTLLLLTLLLFSTLNANKVLYLSYEKLPERVIKGEIFPVKIKTISTVQNFENIKYEFSNYQGLRALNTIPYREKRGKFYLETFHFLVTASSAKTPDITASLVADSEYRTTTINGQNLNVITLNPKNDFSNVIADSFELTDYKAISYDTKHNMIIFTATASNSNLSAIEFKNVFKQGIESVSDSYVNPKITYFVVLDKKLENFSFSYFNLTKNNYSKISLPIIVSDDSVVTQTDLKPTDQSKEKLKMSIAMAVAITILIFTLWRKKYIYLVFVIIPLIYVAYIAVPSKNICIKKDSNIYLLPVKNGTIFETTKSEYHLQKEGSVTEFTKVKLKNEKIGWVKNEDICSY